ncbi:MAG: hypothetical protein UT36_C0006G0040 [Candidatus Peregrinibacteria bacterium GW2011_GWF2_39_17]|nr:MAG: hypothetical protein UT36_C0006G0040 [Candidatus Peregrinibacteria bacterium GW2011_GWF2_39_17]HCW32798.1 hypothetical protein [Candidatus Peregrinibacteria bacterium]
MTEPDGAQWIDKDAFKPTITLAAVEQNLRLLIEIREMFERAGFKNYRQKHPGENATPSHNDSDPGKSSPLTTTLSFIKTTATGTGQIQTLERTSLPDSWQILSVTGNEISGEIIISNPKSLAEMVAYLREKLAKIHTS